MSPTIATIASSLASANRLLGEECGLGAEILLAHVLGKSRTYLRTWPEQVLTSEEQEQFDTLVMHRSRGKPVAYLVGKREFWSIDLTVTAATLIPRADTELLVAEALARIPSCAEWRIADLGTGSGAIALAIAHERPRCQVVATDASPEALNVAMENARRLGLTHVRFLEGNWFAPLAGERFQMIVSNPPYVAEDDPHLSMGDLRFEPPSALASGPDGLRDLRRLITDAPAHLEAEGWLLLEHGFDQGIAVRQLLNGVGLREVRTCQDLEDRDRITLGQVRGR